MAVYKSSSGRFVLDAGETNFTIPAELPGTQTPTPAQSGILGNALANTLTGDATHNGLDGGAGADSLIGGLGDDYYTVDDVGDVIVESANQGIDVVLSTVSFTLGAHVDNILLEGTDELAATGNDLANELIGNGGANTLDGGAGNDTLYGGGGADIFRGGLGSDTVVLSGSSGSTVNLAKGIAYGGRADGITLIDIENIWASFYNDVLTGDAENNVLKGQNGNDRLSGGSGRDRLFGGEGKDILTGGRGKDAFVFDRATTKATRDKIVDFKVKDDSIWLDNEVFTKLGRRGTEDKPVKLSNKFFKFNKPTDKNDYLIYKQKTGVLSYDADGSGKGKAVDIAILKKNLKLTDKDFFII